ncbi:unnamed protein product [Danaus chrysippus]|uniref:(African queen) hypothetical protein n=1 Tax=Danaus chrysippus TaxID=151541 RepID=A0A8J2VR88_9NEOP|nr:unnamed protein product [Danaus chrysippus]
MRPGTRVERPSIFALVHCYTTVTVRRALGEYTSLVVRRGEVQQTRARTYDMETGDPSSMMMDAADTTHKQRQNALPNTDIR